MKKFILAIVTLFTMTVSASAMSYEQARDQALFLTDKMAYELNLTEEQYQAAYETNLDYLMGVNSYDDVYGTYWTHRNLDLSYILLDWQYRAFVNATYFYRPIWWSRGYWHFGIYARYPHRNYFYFGRPAFYNVYCGGHSWRRNGGRSWYHGRRFEGPGPRDGRQFGMRNGFQRGDYRNGFDNNPNRSFGNGVRRSNNQPGGQQFGNGAPVARTQGGNPQHTNTRTFGGNRGNITPRESSTRTTVTRTPSNNSFGGASRGTISTPRQSFTPNRSQSTPSRSFSTPSRSGSSFGGSHSGGFGGSSRPSGGFGGGGSRSGGSFGGHR